MFDNLLKLVKDHAGDAIINNPAIPNEKNDAAIETTTNSIVDTLKAQASAGNVSSLTNLLKGKSTEAPLASSIQSKVVDNLMKKFGIDNTQASQIASTLVPKVMESFVKKTNDPNDKSFELSDVMSSLGINAAGIMDKIGGFFKK
ncbi:MAG: DUF937 domain-containing protein [Bacteroidota bacterium]